MSIKKGFTLVEVIIAIIISIIAIFGIETLIVESFKDWRASKNITELGRDLDLASYQIKGILDEANFDTIYTTISGGTVSDSGIRIVAGYNNNWQKEFSPSPSGKELMYNNTKIINTLQSISFVNGSDKHSVRVNLTVGNGTTRTKDWLDSSFLVYLRNKGRG